jgi:hypothetical protein
VNRSPVLTNQPIRNLIVSIFDRFSNSKPPSGHSEVNFEFTEEELQVVRRTLRRYAEVAREDAPEGMDTYVPKKTKDAMTAQGLTEYVEDLMFKLRRCEGTADQAPLMEKAIQAMTKAYTIHNLPVYLFQIAGMFEFLDDTANAKAFFKQFLQAQNDFKPDGTDITFQDQTG